MKGKERQSNIELLRIVAMFMVVVLHYLVKGQAAVSLVDNFTPLNMGLWLIKAFCIITINVYVLISGYFLVEAQWKLSRVVSLWLQTLFYSIGIPIVCLFLGMEEMKQWGIYDWVNVVFPIQMEHYWFITAYIILYLLVPALSTAVKHMTKEQHQWVIAGLLLVFSIPKTILPIYIPIDRYGYDFGWFICLFFIAAYIRLYGISCISHKKRAFTVYIVTVIGIWGISVICAALTRKGFPLAYMMDMTYCYNHLLVLVASVALFSAVRLVQIPKGRVSTLIGKIAPYTLGVYLLHENLALRTKWQFWAGIDGVRDSWMILVHMLVTAVAVFIAGVIVDFVRDCFFKVVSGTIRHMYAGKTAK